MSSVKLVCSVLRRARVAGSALSQMGQDSQDLEDDPACFDVKAVNHVHAHAHSKRREDGNEV